MSNENKRPTALNNKALLFRLQPFGLISCLKKKQKNFCSTISVEIWNILSEGSRFQCAAFYIKQTSGAQWKENKMQITSNTLL